MSNKSGVAEQVLSLPKGGGAIKGIGEKFQPDLHTGTGNFSIPITTLPGRNGFDPELSLSYSTGSGNGPFGLGWAIGVPNVSRKISKGIPIYLDRFDAQGNPVWHEEEDIFILSGAEDLVHVGNGFYRPRTEGLFALIRKISASDSEPCWVVTTKNGARSVYGKTAASRLFVEEDGKTRIFQWFLSETEDTFGNKIVYEYKRDDGADLQTDLATHPEERNHTYNQIYLKSIAYVNYQESDVEVEKFLWRVEFDYGQHDDAGNEVKVWDARPDALSGYRSGFEIRTARRCKRILIKRRLDGVADRYELLRSYELKYQQAPLSNSSLLNEVILHGHKDGVTESLPPLTFGYTDFDPTQREYEVFSAHENYLPRKSLSDPNYELIDLVGNGLPGIIHTGPTGHSYWRNLGDLKVSFPRPINHVPAGVTLADDGVQFADMEGNGSADLLVTTGAARGYYANDFSGEWKEFHHYHQAPSFNLRDANVRLVDMDGDGVIDVLATHQHHFLYIRNTSHGNGLAFSQPIAIERKHDLNEFPDVFFGAPDQRVLLADMTGDGMQDIVLMHDRLIQYWPNLGHGKFGKQITMRSAPRLAHRYDSRRLFLSDIDGDGLADLIYVDFGKTHLWINRNGNGWSDEIVIHGTPLVTDADSVQLADMKGTGTAGILWSYDYNAVRDSAYKFLDLTGGVKPYLLKEMNNHIGAVTRVAYTPSTRFYLDDEKLAETRWQTSVPFPVQVVAHVEVIDAISGGKLTTEYSYHHGYWDGAEREFRGFGRVDQRDTEVFEVFNTQGLHPDSLFEKVQTSFSPPLETRTWFHHGPVGKEFGEWGELDLSSEFWPGDPQLLPRPSSMTDFLDSLPRRVKRDAVRALRGSILRTELYALDGTERQDRPYTVTESLFGVREETLPLAVEAERPRIFFPHILEQRTSQWERGDDPMSQFAFIEHYDDFGRARQQTAVALPRRGAKRQESGETVGVNETRILATCTLTEYATPDPDLYLHDSVAQVRAFELADLPPVIETEPDNLARVLDEHATAARAIHRQFQTLLDDWTAGQTLPNGVRLFSHALNHYDGEAFVGRVAGEVGPHGAVTRGESLIFTDAELNTAYGDQRPSYLGGSALLPSAAPGGFGNNLGYRLERRSTAGYHDGYYIDTQRQRLDFQDPTLTQKRGLVVAVQDALGNESTIMHDRHWLVPVEVSDAAGLVTRAAYDYRVLQPAEITDPNGNRLAFSFTALGLLANTSVRGKTGDNGGDQTRASVQMTYDFLAFNNSPSDGRRPISVSTLRHIHHDTETDLSPEKLNETIKTIEYSDGFGRLLQTRTQGENVRFGHAVFGGEVMPKDHADLINTRRDVSGIENTDTTNPNVVVSGWQTYDNKGRVVEKYEPFFSTGWDYARPASAAGRNEFGQKATISYDPRGQVIRTLNPDGSEERVIYGVPLDLTKPEKFDPTPWEFYTYDENDNAARTPIADLNSTDYEHHWNTPASALVDALGRTRMTVERNRARHNPGDALEPIEEFHTRSTYDIQGNLLTVSDALGRVAFEHRYDLGPRLLSIESVDAGTRLTVLDALGNPVEQRDSKGAIILREYDQLNRPLRLWAQDGTGQEFTLRERLVYGDSADSGLSESQARSANLLGKLFKHYDEAGLLSFERYDFKGNLLEKTRQVIKDDAILAVFNSLPPNQEMKVFRVNWEPLPSAAADLLDIQLYQTSMTYDALNRVVTMLYPIDVKGGNDPETRKILRPQYNRAGALERVEMDGETYVQHIAYSAKGQRTLIAYGNRVMTRHAYDEQTFRLVRMRTEHYNDPATDTFRPNGMLLQDFAYRYDLAGNITRIQDRTPESGLPFLPDQLDRTFTYDPLYRLLTASGRECDTPPAVLPDHPWLDTPRCHEATRTRAYTQTYAYDAAGNMTQLHHQTTPGAFNRDFTFVSGTNQLLSVTDTGVPNSYRYDANGNLSRENRERHFEWDHSDRLRVYRTQPAGAPPSIHAHYFYDASGQRVKKLVRKSANRYEVTVYIDGVFEHHRLVNPVEVRENNTLHVMDDQSRMALVRVGRAFPDDGAPDVRVKYHLGDHLGSSSVVLNDGGAFINREEYFPYGETSFGSFARKRYRFTGKERDEESGLYYYGARYYSPWLARWISCDPQPSITELNLFAYSMSSPLTYKDLQGFQSQPTEQFRSELLKENAVSGSEAHKGLNDRLRGKGQTIVGQEVKTKSGLGGSTHDTITNTRSLESKSMDVSKRTYRSSDGNLAKGRVKGRVTRSIKQALKHQAALQERGLKTLGRKPGVPLKESLVFWVKGATPEDIAQIRDMARSLSKEIAQDAGLPKGQHIRVGVIPAPTPDAKMLQRAEPSLSVAKKAGGKALSTGGKVLRVVPFLGVGVAIHSIQDNLRKGNYSEAALDAIGMVPIIGDAVDLVRLGMMLLPEGNIKYIDGLSVTSNNTPGLGNRTERSGFGPYIPEW